MIWIGQFYAVYQTLFDDLTDSFKGIEGALSLLEESDKQKSKLFIFDDLQTEVVNSREISSLFKYGTHHMKSEQGQNWLLDQAAYSITKPAPAGKGG